MKKIGWFDSKARDELIDEHWDDELLTRLNWMEDKVNEMREWINEHETKGHPGPNRNG